MRKYICISLVLIISLSNLTLNAQIQSSIISRAVSLSEKGEYEQTISLLLNAEYMFLESDSTDFNILYHLHLGNAYLQTQVYDKAEAHLLDCFTRIEKKYSKYSKEYCNLYHLLVQVYELSDNYDKLSNSYLNYLDVIEKVYGKDIPIYSENLFKLGQLYLQLSQYNLSEKYLLQSLEMIEKNLGKENIDYISIYTIVGMMYENIENFEKARTAFEDIKGLIKNNNDKDTEAFNAFILFQLGSVELSAGNIDLSEKYLLEAKQILERIKQKDVDIYINVIKLLGQLYIVKKQYIQAETYLMDAKRLYLQLGGNVKDIKYAEINVCLAHFYDDIRNYKSAEFFYLESIQILKETIETENITYTATIITELGAMYFKKMKDYVKAKEVLIEAKEMLENNKQKNTVMYMQTILLLGEVYMKNNQYTQAETYIMDAKELYLQLGCNMKGIEYAAINVCLAHFYDGIRNYKSAELFYLESIQILKEIIGVESTTLAVETMVELAWMYVDMQDYEKAIEILIESKNIQKKTFGTNSYEYASTLAQMGRLYLKVEDFQLAEEYLFKSKEIYEGGNHKEEKYAVLLSYIHSLYNKMGNSKLATDYLLKMSELNTDLLGKHSQDYAQDLLSLATLYSERGNDSLAITHALPALLIFKANLGEEHLHYINTLNVIGLIRLDQGLYNDAEQALLTANELYIKVFGKNHYGQKHLLNNLAYFYMKQYKYDLALKYILEAKALLDKEDSIDAVFSIYRNIIHIYWSLGQYEKSFQYLQKWNDYLVQVINRNFSFMSTKQRKDFWNKSDVYDLEYFTKNVLIVYSSPEAYYLAYNTTLFFKGLLLRSSNEIRDAILNSDNQELKDKFAELQSLRQQIIALESKTDSAMLIYKQTLEEQAEQLDKDITLISADYRDIKADLNMNWQDVQKNLKENEVAIEFIDFDLFNKQWIDSVMYAALLIRKDSEAPEYIPLFDEPQLEALLNDENPELSKRIQKLYGGSNPRLFNGQKLYNLIWKPLESHLEGIETVYYSPSGLLNRVSFAAIPVDTLLLNDKYNLQLLSSTREIPKLKKGENSFLPVQQAVAYGGIVYDIENTEELVESAQQYKNERIQYVASRSLPNDSTRSGWAYLQGTEKEVVEVEHILQKSQVPNITYMGVAANEESFKSLSGQAPELLHIATHGFFLEDEKQIRETGFMQLLGTNKRKTYVNPLLRSGLLFAGANRAWKNENVIPDIEDGILTAEEISQLNLSNTKLVVLSACETGLGEVQNSEGVFGLQRAFKLAGVETLVMSLWKVDDATTNDFMIAFYQNLLSGKTKLQSFKAAQQAIRAKYSNPYYWAAFVMMD